MNCLNQLFQNPVRIYINIISPPLSKKKNPVNDKNTYIYQWASMTCEYVVNFSQVILGDGIRNVYIFIAENI